MLSSDVESSEKATETMNNLIQDADCFVNRHIRTLANGYCASQEKSDLAKEYGIDLKPGQTWVEGYMKGCRKY